MLERDWDEVLAKEKKKNPHKGEKEKIEIGSDCIERAEGGVKGRKINGGYSKNI